MAVSELFGKDIKDQDEDRKSYMVNPDFSLTDNSEGKNTTEYLLPFFNNII
jgi:hypothetical protein